jgi:hypothetical protein
LKACKSFSEKNQFIIAEFYNNIGSIYDLTVELDKALKYKEMGLKICQTIFGDNHPFTAEYLNSIGITYDLKLDFD